ncbi:hypothetical protein Bca52824_045738 [Brassica carinata]|uniref:Uncharacterized protein n=1 Tax=Brassica carinata TaxID=52824 RepID=A0A8X7RIR0_BRACI|nr:hypothetical protein Bca52824_045738 [Brassica carinata]
MEIITFLSSSRSKDSIVEFFDSGLPICNWITRFLAAASFFDKIETISLRRPLLIRTSASFTWRSSRAMTESTSLCVLSFPSNKFGPSHLAATEAAAWSVSRAERRSRASWLEEEEAAISES